MANVLTIFIANVYEGLIFCAPPRNVVELTIFILYTWYMTNVLTMLPSCLTVGHEYNAQLQISIYRLCNIKSSASTMQTLFSLNKPLEQFTKAWVHFGPNYQLLLVNTLTSWQLQQ